MFSGIIRLTVLSALISIVHLKYLQDEDYETLIVPENNTSESFYSYSIKHSGGSTSEQNVTVLVVDGNNIESEKIIQYPSKAKQSKNSNKTSKYLHSQYKKEDLLNFNKTQEADLEQEYLNMNILKLPIATDNKIMEKKKNRSSKYRSHVPFTIKQKNLSKEYSPPTISSTIETTTLYDIIPAPYTDINVFQDQIQTINQLVSSQLNLPEEVVSTTNESKINNEQDRKSSILQNNRSADQIVSETQNDVHYIHYIPLEEQTTTSSIVIKQIDNGDNTEIDVISNKKPNKEQLNFIENIVKSIVHAADKQQSPQYNIQSVTASTTEQSFTSQFEIPAELSLPPQQSHQVTSNIYNLNEASNYPLYPPLHNGQQFTNLPSQRSLGPIHSMSAKPHIIISASNKQSLVEQLQSPNNFFQQANQNYQKYNILEHKLKSGKKSNNQEADNFKPNEYTGQKSREKFFKQENKFRTASHFAEPPNNYPSYDEKDFQEHGLRVPEQGESTYKVEDSKYHNYNSHAERPNNYRHEYYAINYGYQNNAENNPRPTPKSNTKFRPKQPLRKPQKPLKEILIIRKKPSTERKKHIIYLKKIVEPIRKLQVRKKAQPVNVIKVSILKHPKRQIKNCKDDHSC